MIEHNAARFFAIAQKLTSLIKLIERMQDSRKQVSESEREIFVSQLSKIEDDCRAISLDMVLLEVRRTKSNLNDCTYIHLAQRFANIYERIYDQLSQKSFFYLPDDRRAFYIDPRNEFGEKICNAFSECLHDIEEAGKCYGFGRWSATIFHLMRITESGLKFMCGEASQYGIIFPEHNNSWDSWLKPLDKQFSKRHEEKTVEWKKVESKYAEIAADLRNVSKAWRNPTMHVGINYDQEHAFKIYSAVKHFMGDLTKKLKEA